MRRLLVVRHGDTFLPSEAPRRIGARTDLPLTPNGEAQARAVAPWLIARGRHPDVLLTGPLQRAARTASIIATGLPRACEARTAGWLDEVDYGPDEGRPESEVAARIGAAALERWELAAEPAPGWPIDRARKIRECRSAIGDLPTGTALLVTSNGTARFILLALGLAGAVTALKLRTGAVGEIEIVDDRPRLCFWNSRPAVPASGREDIAGRAPLHP